MCTVTFWPTGRAAYRLAMNRDEQRSRPPAEPPRVFHEHGRHAVHPAEPTGGTWISLNDTGVSLALVNWYAITREPRHPPRSRGEVVAALRTVDGPDALAHGLTSLDHRGRRPFRLVGVFPATAELVEWRWDLDRLCRLTHPWEPGQWISSGLDEAGAQRARAAVFEVERSRPAAGSHAWLRALHRSHVPFPGATSTCVHRTDAVTVSSTEIEVGPGTLRLGYQPGPPCEDAARLEIQLPPHRPQA